MTPKEKAIKQTAMQEVFDRIEEFKKKYDKNSLEYEIFGKSSHIVWCRLEKEKEQIINCGRYIADSYENSTIPVTPEQYYIETFKQD
jgi:hypothetical protein